MKKKVALLTLCALFACVLCVAGCGSQEPANQAGLANPVHETDQAGMTQATGIDLSAPEGAVDVQYSYIDSEAGSAIAQIVYKDADGLEWTYRAQATGGTEPEDISGLFYTWDNGATGEVSYCPAVANACDECSVCTWYDVVPGINYSLSVNTKKDCAGMFQAAAAVFTPAQGDA